MEGLKPGRVVYYMLNAVERHDNNEADCAPAIVTRVWPDGVVNLKVLLDGPQLWWRTSVPFDAGGSRANTWHWVFEGQQTRYRPDRVELATELAPEAGE